MSRALLLPLAVAALISPSASAQAPKGQAPAATPGAATPGAAATANTPPDFVIGIEDVLDVRVLADKEMSVDGLIVRPDGKISLPQVNEIHAQGKTVPQLTADLEKAVAKYVKVPEVSVMVKQINSLKVFITGEVGKPGEYSLLSPMRVVELIAKAGDVSEFANRENIRITRVVNGKDVSLQFNYKDFMKGKQKALEQNIPLRPGDIVTVP
jgi:polysaccharide export outer membrane protein